MKFCDKLDVLIRITHTSNSALAASTSLDASYISRLRRGVRNLPKSENYVPLMADYFAKHCLEDFQIKALRECIPQSYIVSNDQSENARSIIKWLKEDSDHSLDSVQGLLDVLEDFQFKKPQSWSKIESADHIETKRTLVSIFYGSTGKQEATLAFLLSVINCSKPQTLLLFSDESFDWIGQNPEFAARWAALMSQVIAQGNRICMIHTISRNLDEMLAGLSKWLPLYMTGAIEPYYYPKTRDGLFKRTLFIAPETAAVISNSVGNMEDEAANFLITDKKAVRALTSEYNNLLALCRPLMRIFTCADSQAYNSILYEFEKESADAIVKAESFGILTMPDVVADGIIARMEQTDGKEIADYLSIRKKNFMEHLLAHNFTEIITIPALDKMKEGRLRVALPDSSHMQDVFYTRDELILHLENMVMLLKTYPNYHVYIDTMNKNEGFMLYAKEDVGVIIAKTSAPAITFAINESNMTVSFWDYLDGIIYRIRVSQLDDNSTIQRLQSLIEQLKA
jgi:hypothetical protein